jgi:phospholipid/cholesterol/gamma-HCH transport system permease protein
MSPIRAKRGAGAEAENRFVMKLAAGIGAALGEHWRELQHAAAVVGAAFWIAARRRYWKRSTRQLFARQILAVGVEPLGFVCAVAGFLGVSVVVQLAFWTAEAGQSQRLGPILVTVVIRELAPLLTNIIVIVRGSGAMATELGLVKLSWKGGRNESEDGDPFATLVAPRVLGMAVSSFCLTIVFIAVTFASGYFFGAWRGTGSRDPWFFLNTILNAFHPADAFSVLGRSVLPALFTGACCCIGGLGCRSIEEIPRAAQRALTRSIAGLFVVWVVSTYIQP